MSSISQFLPEPKHTNTAKRQPKEDSQSTQLTTTTAATKSVIPPYGQRNGWMPKRPSDFGNGGAYPEILCLQYPQGMGRPTSKKPSNALTKHTDSDGNTSYQALAQYGRREGTTVHSQFKDLIPLRQRKDFKDSEDAIPERPSEDLIKETTERTKQALATKMGEGVNNNNKKIVNRDEPTFVRYTANNQTQRLVRVTDMPVDPMEPPKIKHQKRARKPASPPAPVMHSPPRKVTADEQKQWVIPPCVSNWKNIHGFTVSLDKRLAADGEEQGAVEVNDNFARLSEALISAESNARKEIAERAKIQQTLVQREKETKEERLRTLAQRAREERAQTGSNRKSAVDYMEAPPLPPSTSASKRRSISPDDGEREREEQRRERRRQHERELKLSRMGNETKAKYLRKSTDRDISEKIALGIAQPTGGNRESLYDSRLFNQPSASNASLQNEEAYNLYDKPLFASKTSAGNYRPKTKASQGDRGGEVQRMMETDRFGKGLQPVKFEKGDVFGIDAFADKTRQEAKKK